MKRPLISELKADLDGYYYTHGDTLGNPNYHVIGNNILWNNYLPREPYQDYEHYYDWTFDNMQYSFMLGDDSLIQLAYTVSGNSLSNGCLAYIPHPVACEDNGLVYVRLDCDPQAHRDFVHTMYHAHIGSPDAKMRISLRQFPLPSQFLDFVLVTGYEHTYLGPGKKSKHIKDLDSLALRYAHRLELA